MTPTGSVGSARASAVSDAVSALSRLALAPAELVHEAAQRIRSIVPCAVDHWWIVDPETMLATDLCGPGAGRHADQILSAADFETFDRLDRDGTESSVEGATLRLACRSGGATWVIAHLEREPEGQAFSPAEAQYIVGLGGYVAAGVRAYLADAPWVPGESVVPGLIGVDGEERIRDATPEGVYWLEKLMGSVDGPLPHALRGLVHMTREGMVGSASPRPAKVRIRLPDGRWGVARCDRLVVQREHTAVLIKAATRADLRSLHFFVHGLTQRERELTELLIEGKDLQDVAAALNLSIHTVRSHVKAIFAKVDVTSRAELTAALG